MARTYEIFVPGTDVRSVLSSWASCRDITNIMSDVIMFAFKTKRARLHTDLRLSKIAIQLLTLLLIVVSAFNVETFPLALPENYWNDCLIYLGVRKMDIYVWVLHFCLTCIADAAFNRYPWYWKQRLFAGITVKVYVFQAMPCIYIYLSLEHSGGKILRCKHSDLFNLYQCGRKNVHSAVFVWNQLDNLFCDNDAQFTHSLACSRRSDSGHSPLFARRSLRCASLSERLEQATHLSICTFIRQGSK